jgi:hypothetical protein
VLIYSELVLGHAEQEEKMSVKRLTIAAFFVACTLMPRARAQEKNEISGIIGRTFISNQTINGSTVSDSQLRFGNGLTFEGNYARRILDANLFSLSLEVPVLFNLDEDLHASLPNRTPEYFRSFMVTPSARLNVFPDQGISPWVSVGGGFGHFTEGSTLLFGGTNPGKGGTTTGVFQAGAGLDVKFFKTFKLRGEIRDFWSGVPALPVPLSNSRQHNLFVGGGIVWQF